MASKPPRQRQQIVQGKRPRKKQTPKQKKRSGSKLSLESTTTSVSRSELSIHDEFRYIVARAREHDARIVGVAGLVLFSTDTGDAWALDPEDGLAACLARGGTPQELTVLETESQFAETVVVVEMVDSPFVTESDADAARGSKVSV